MKKTLAIVLALAMVLCMIPAAFAATTQVITDKNYNITVVDAESNTKLGEATNANSVTAKYDYEAIKTVVTGKFTEDKKMALVKVSGFESLTEVTSVTVDGKDLKVNELAAYYNQVNYNGNTVTFPVELTKSGYTDSFVISVKGKTSAINGIETTETAKISVTLKNTADYKNAKTAVIKSISSNQKEMDAYIVGSKIYLDLVESDKATGLNGKTVDITFGDENGANFTKVTWASDPAKVLKLVKEVKLDKSTATYYTAPENLDKTTKLSFKLETADAIYETKEYSVVIRTDVKEADPKGIYFAESTKTIKVGESYTPVVMGVETGKKVKAEIEYGTAYGSTVKVNAQYIDLEDKKTVIGTQEGVAYITASYTTNNGVKYTASSMKIVVAGEAEVAPAGTTTYYVTCRNLNVRKGAGTSYAKVGMLHRGNKVEVVSISNNWAKLANGTYVSAKYIAK